MHAGAQEDNYGEDGAENVDYDAGHSTIKLEISGWLSSWASTESRGEDSMHEIDGFFSDVDSNIDGRYEELKAKLQVALVEYGALPLTKYDKLVSDEINVWDGEHANQDDEDEPGEYGDPNDRPEPKDKEERQEAFEEQFKNVLVAFDDELSEITFQGLSFPPPAALASDEVSVIGDTPRNKDYILRRALITMEQVMDKQPSLPGIVEGDDEDFEMFRGVVSRNDIVGYFFTFKSVCKLEIEMKLGVLTESEMDSVVAGMKIIDRNFKLFQIAMRDALERYIKMNPDEMRWAKDKAEPPQDAVQRGAPIGATLGAPVRAEGISEIVADEVTKAMNESFVLENCPPGARFNTETGKPCENPKSEEEVRKEVDEFISSKLSKEDYSFKTINKVLKKSLMAYIQDDKEEEKKWEIEADRLQDLYISQTIKKFELKSKRAQLIKRFGGTPTKREIESADLNAGYFKDAKANQEEHRKKLEDMENDHEKKMKAMANAHDEKMKAMTNSHDSRMASQMGGGDVDVFSKDFDLERDFDKLSSQQFAYLLDVGIKKSEKGDGSALKKLGVAMNKSRDKKHAAEMKKIVAKYGPKNEASYFGKKAMNEIEPYQKKAKKLQKKAMELSIKGPNKYMAKGMKIATAKPGKSAPPGV
jgi:hypothetical protein